MFEKNNICDYTAFPAIDPFLQQVQYSVYILQSKRFSSTGIQAMETQQETAPLRQYRYPLSDVDASTLYPTRTPRTNRYSSAEPGYDA